jgi:DNA-binding transcriptional LysR family regulator
MFYGILRAIEETARVRSIRKASEALGVAPSSVSRNIAILEREMGTALLERRSDGVELTHAGKLVADYARSVLLDYDSLRADLDDMRGMQRKVLRLALVEGAAASGPPEAISKMLQRFPSLSFNVRIMPAPAVFEAVLRDRCDVGIAYCAEANPDILTMASIPEPMVVVVRPDHELSSLPKINLRDLVGRPIAVPDHDFGVRRILDRASAEAGIHLAPVLTSNDFEFLRGFARSGAGAAILPMRAAANEEKSGRLKAVPLAAAPFRNATIDIIVLRKRRLPRVTKTFADILTAEIRGGV